MFQPPLCVFDMLPMAISGICVIHVGSLSWMSTKFSAERYVKNAAGGTGLQ
jgi:hypothetical protein